MIDIFLKKEKTISKSTIIIPTIVFGLMMGTTLLLSSINKERQDSRIYVFVRNGAISVTQALKIYFSENNIPPEQLKYQISQILTSFTFQGYDIDINNLKNNITIYSKSTIGSFKYRDPYKVSTILTLPNYSFQITVWPSAKFMEENELFTNYLILLFGFIISILFSFLTYILTKLQISAISIKEINNKLHKKALSMSLLYEGTLMISTNHDFKGALQNCIDLVRQAIEWPVGHVYFQKDKKLISSDIWSIDPEINIDNFKTVSDKLEFTKHEGLPGKIWERKRATWIEDIQSESNFPRANLSSKIQLHSAFGFPIISDGNIIAIAEFFTDKIIPEDKELLQTFITLGMQISRVHEKQLAEEQVRLEREKFRQLAHYDYLTGLLNRVSLEKEINQEISFSSRKENMFGILYIDLDNFKEVNDNLGHDVGDEVLIEVSSRLTKSMRDYDLVARLGGDEFIVLVRDIPNEEEALLIANKIIESISKPYPIIKNIKLGASIGVAVYPEHGTAKGELLKHADMALYRAKESGRGKAIIYDRH